MCWKWPPFASRQDWTRRAIFWKVLVFQISAKNKHSLLQIIPIHFPTILCELTHYTNTHEQQPYCVGTLSQTTERSAERLVRQETGWLAGGPLLRVATTRCTTDTFLFISHTTNLFLFKFRCNIFIGVRIIKEIPGLVASGTPCISRLHTPTLCASLLILYCRFTHDQPSAQVLHRPPPYIFSVGCLFQTFCCSEFDTQEYELFQSHTPVITKFRLCNINRS